MQFRRKGTVLNLSVPLFDTCNLGCEFCYENHGKIQLTRESFSNVLTDIKKQVVPRIKKDNYQTLAVRFYGGEIFFDQQPDWIYEEYRKLIEQIRKMIPIRVTTKFITNGVFSKYERADRLLKDTDSIVGMSYDLEGRYRKKEQKEKFIQTFNHFYESKVLKEVSMLITKPAIKKLIAGDEFFESIPDDLRIDVCGYMPNRNWEKYLPSARDYADFYKWAIKKRKFNIERILNLFRYAADEEREQVERFCDCDSMLTYLPMERRFSGECIERHDFAEACYGKAFKTVNEENCFQIKTDLMMQKAGCLYCSYFKNCPMQCAAAVLFKEYKQEICPVRSAIESITPEDISAYRDWREMHHA